jgi:hypothetical protein
LGNHKLSIDTTQDPCFRWIFPLTLAQELISPGDFMTAFDLEYQFFQVRLAPSMKKFFVFPCHHRQGPSTISSPLWLTTVSVLTRLLKPVKAFLHRHGVKFSIYVDDGHISAASPSLCLQHHYLALHILQLAGWKVQWKKTISMPTTSLVHLGFITDTLRMEYSIKPEKWTASVASRLTTRRCRPPGPCS